MSLASELNKIQINWNKSKYLFDAAMNGYFNPNTKVEKHDSKKRRHDFDIKYQAMMRWELRYFNKKKQIDKLIKEIG